MRSIRPPRTPASSAPWPAATRARWPVAVRGEPAASGGSSGGRADASAGSAKRAPRGRHQLLCHRPLLASGAFSARSPPAGCRIRSGLALRFVPCRRGCRAPLRAVSALRSGAAPVALASRVFRHALSCFHSSRPANHAPGPAIRRSPPGPVRRRPPLGSPLRPRRSGTHPLRWSRAARTRPERDRMRSGRSGGWRRSR